MQEKEKINVSGEMKSLDIGGSFTLGKKDYVLSSVRVTANTIKQDTSKEFTVSVEGEEITVKRVG